MKLAADPTLRGFGDPRAVAGLVLGGELTSLIDFDAPVDVLFLPSPSERPSMVGVARPVNAAQFDPRKLGEMLRPLAPGRWQLHPADGGEQLRCELWHVKPPVGYRVLCGLVAQGIEQAAPFLLGKLAVTESVADARVEMSQAFFKDAIAATPASEPEPAPDGTASSARERGRQLGKRWVESIAEAESIALNVQLSDENVELGLELDYDAKRASPLFQRWLLSSASQPALPPQFWQVLDESPIAFVSATTDAETTKQLTAYTGSSLGTLLSESLAEAGTTVEDLQRMQAAGGDSGARRASLHVLDVWPAIDDGEQRGDAQCKRQGEQEFLVHDRRSHPGSARSIRARCAAKRETGSQGRAPSERPPPHQQAPARPAQRERAVSQRLGDG
ncbi:MAG: hypothetical protein QM756_33850 [Polyangiaceae bacterium]